MARIGSVLKKRIGLLRAASASMVVALLGLLSVGASGQQHQGNYTIRLDEPQQKILGLGFEIQSDSIGSGNHNMPDEVIAVPHDLTPGERKRFYHDMLHGFRYSRLAMGLYLRGLDASKQHIVERYPGEMDDLREMMEQSAIQGFDVEYWSPAPFWKTNGRYEGGTVKPTDAAFVNAFADAMIDDLKYLQSHGLRVSMWGLQNEPGQGDLTKDPTKQMYSTCFYSAHDYFEVMKVVAPRVHALIPGVQIHATSWLGNADKRSVLIREDPEVLSQVDAWTWHQIGHNSDDQIHKQAEYLANAAGKPVYQNEFEYQPWHSSKPSWGVPSDGYFINTAQSIMNWMVFENSPTWLWLHALKPVSNFEAKGYALGFWRPPHDADVTIEPQLKPGHWEYNPQNWNAIAGFLRYLPWDSVRLTVDEDTVRDDDRIMAWKTPDGKLGLVITNRSGAPFRFDIALGKKLSMHGARYTEGALNKRLSSQSSDHLHAIVPNQAIEFWLER